MTEPFTPQMVTGVLRTMHPDRLAKITPIAFQTWPTRKIVPGHVILELIANEKARRIRNGS